MDKFQHKCLNTILAGAAMKRFLILLTAGWLLCPMTNYGSETAQARMFCLSLQFQEAATTSSYDGSQWLLDLTTQSSGLNGELAPSFLTTSYTHSAYLQLYEDLFGTTDQGYIGLNVPNAGADAEGFPNFFDVSQGITNLSAAGVLQSQSSQGFYPNATAFQAAWNRPAGSSTGTCSFQVYDPDNPVYSLQYTFPFTLLQYTGPLTYTPGANLVSAAVNLSQTGTPANTLQGPIDFVKSSTDRFNTLTNQPGVWTNAAMQPVAFTNELFLRDTTLRTNYSGYVEFPGGGANAGEPGYILWVLSIDDTNDANANGIPDFSDDPAGVAPPRAPHLSLALGTTNLLLTISGDTGHTNQIQQIGSLNATNWQTTLSFLLTNDPQVVSLPLPAGTPNFWRVAAQ
jgi:hypothetical protein